MADELVARSPSTAIVMAVARRLEREPMDLPPLQETIDTDALDALFSGPGPGEPREPNGCEVRFHYAGLEVHVRGDGDVTLEPTAGDDSVEGRGDAPAGP